MLNQIKGLLLEFKRKMGIFIFVVLGLIISFFFGKKSAEEKRIIKEQKKQNYEIKQFIKTERKIRGLSYDFLDSILRRKNK